MLLTVTRSHDEWLMKKEVEKSSRGQPNIPKAISPLRRWKRSRRELGVASGNK